LVHLFDQISKEQLEQLISKHLQNLSSKEIIISDCGWSHRGWNANEAVVVCFEASQSMLKGMEIICRKLDSDTIGDFTGTSSQMEAEGIYFSLYLTNFVFMIKKNL
jgi:hypothetical protein